MTSAPFAVDAGERAGKSLAGGVITWVFENVIANGTHVLGAALQWWHSIEFGLGAAAVSVVFSFLSRARTNPEGQRTASLLKVVEYDPATGG